MKHIFVPLDIRNELETRFVDSDVLEDFKNMEILPISELVKKDLFDFLSFFPKCNLGAISNIEHSFLISPFKVNIADLELLDNLSKRFERTFGTDIVIHVTMSEHTAVLLNREFWLSFVNNFNFVISDVWEPKFLHINEKLSMSNVFDNIKYASDKIPPFYVSFIKPNADPRMNKWLNTNEVPKSSFYNFDYFIFDTFYQSGITSDGSYFQTGDIKDVDKYISAVMPAKKVKDLVCLNRSYKYHRPRIINDLYERDLLSKSYFSLAEISVDEEEYTVVKDLGVPILANGEPKDNIDPHGRMLHDSVANIDWVKNAKLFVSTESLMFDTISSIPNYTDYNIKFISEKVHKPLAWGMPFVVFGCYGSLAHMKNIGFKTYEPFIDESYDTITNAEDRYNACVSSISEFLNKPYPREELNKISEHNLKLFYSNDLYNNLVDVLINEILNNYTNNRERDDFLFRNQ